MMRRFLFLLILAPVLLTMMPNSAKAADPSDSATCNCYCGDTTSGALPPSTASYANSDQCKTACKTAGKQFISCGSDISELPISNALCWKQDECTAKSNTEWSSEQPAECPSTYHYCYIIPTSTPLNVSIAGTTVTLNIGSYINLIYTYGLGIAAVLAIVMIMIGGAQYIIGSASGGEAVTAAKSRITNAITGLVLLAFAYLLLATINPALVQFKLLKLPLVKPSLFVTASCQDYKDKDYLVDDEVTGAEECGDKGTVTTDPSGTKIASNSSCTYTTCKNPGSLCGPVGTGFDCMTCDDGGKQESITAGFDASASNCSVLTPTETDTQKDRCVSETAGFLFAILPSGFSYGQKYCARLEVSCPSITTCEDYDTVQTFVGGDGTGDNFSSGAYGYVGQDKFEALCTDNPCAKTVTNGPCTFHPRVSTNSNNPLASSLIHLCQGS